MQSLKYFWVGIAFYIFSMYVLRRLGKSLNWLETFLHELTHVFFIYLSGQRVENFEASRNNGGIVHYKGQRNIFISLGPYFFPILVFPFLFTMLIVSPKFIPFIEGAIGIVSALHLTAFIKQLSPQQSDLLDYGIGLSYSFVFCMNLYFWTCILFFIQMDSLKAFIWFIK